jgi:tetratricopeptide (TPR) repeat protein
LAEVAMNFKNHGNELYSQKTYKEAVEAYTQGVTAGPVDFDLRISLLNNRAAANLALKNYRATLKDTGAIIALSIKAGKVPPVKSLYRSGQALICLERWDEARDVVKRGREMKGEENKPEWKKLGEDVEKGQRTVEERRERERRTTLGKIALKRAIQVGPASPI